MIYLRDIEMPAMKKFYVGGHESSFTKIYGSLTAGFYSGINIFCNGNILENFVNRKSKIIQFPNII